MASRPEPIRRHQAQPQPGINIEALLAHVPLFNGWRTEEIARIARGTREVNAARGDILFHKGDLDRLPPDRLRPGKTGLHLAARRRKSRRHLGQGQTFGEAVMFMDKPYMVFAQALSRLAAAAHLQDGHPRRTGTRPQARPQDDRRLSMRLHHLITDVESYSLHSGRQRIIGYLLRDNLDERRKSRSPSPCRPARASSPRASTSRRNTSRASCTNSPKRADRRRRAEDHIPGCRKAARLRSIGAALCIINLLLTMLVMAEWFDNWHYPPIFGHIRHLGLSIGFLTILLFARTESSALVGAFFRITRILGLALVFWSGTRASIVAWLCCMVIFVILDRSWLKTLLIDTATAATLSLIPSPAFPVNQWTPGTMARTLGTLSGNTGSSDVPLFDRVTSGRMKIWQSTIAGLADVGRLWTGVGGNGFARLQVMHGVGITPPGHIHPHNVVIQAVVDWGLIGAALLTGFFYKTVVQPAIQCKKTCDPTALAGIIYLLVTGMLDATLFHLEHLNYFAIAVAYLIRKLPGEPHTKLTLPAAGPIIAIVGFALLHTQTMDYRIGLWWYFRTG
jgi:hypothetical protein